MISKGYEEFYEEEQTKSNLMETSLELIEILENLKKNRPKVPTKHYKKQLEYYKNKLKEHKL